VTASHGCSLCAANKLPSLPDISSHFKTKQ